MIIVVVTRQNKLNPTLRSLNRVSNKRNGKQGYWSQRQQRQKAIVQANDDHVCNLRFVRFEGPKKSRDFLSGLKVGAV